MTRVTAFVFICIMLGINRHIAGYSHVYCGVFICLLLGIHVSNGMLGIDMYNFGHSYVYCRVFINIMACWVFICILGVLVFKKCGHFFPPHLSIFSSVCQTDISKI